MVLPELALVLSRKGSRGRRTGHLVVPQGEVLEEQPYLAGILIEHLLEERDEARTVGSLEVVVNGHRHRCIDCPLDR